MPVYPPSDFPNDIGRWEAQAQSGGGYLFDKVLEYRVWFQPPRGYKISVDTPHGSIRLNHTYIPTDTYENAKRISDKLEESGINIQGILVLVEQKPGHWVDWGAVGPPRIGTRRRITEWRPEWLPGSRFHPKKLNKVLVKALEEYTEGPSLVPTPKIRTLKRPTKGPIRVRSHKRRKR